MLIIDRLKASLCTISHFIDMDNNNFLSEPIVEHTMSMFKTYENCTQSELDY
jgi:hypothetical protein